MSNASSFDVFCNKYFCDLDRLNYYSELRAASELTAFFSWLVDQNVSMFTLDCYIYGILNTSFLFTWFS